MCGRNQHGGERFRQHLAGGPARLLPAASRWRRAHLDQRRRRDAGHRSAAPRSGGRGVYGSRAMKSYYEATARERIAGILDAGSWREILPPTTRTLSPHLAALDLPAA